MKYLFLLASSLFFNVALASSAITHRAHVYRYMGSFSDLTGSLEKNLAVKIAEECGEKKVAFIKTMSINLKLGTHTSGDALPVEAVREGDSMALSFPHHPYAEVLALFECR